jgi:ubiquilin
MGAAGDSSESKVINEQQGQGEEGAVVINIRCSNGTKFTVRTSLESTVGVFKSLLAQNCDVPPDQQRLIYKGRILKDDLALHSYGEFISFLYYRFFLFYIFLSEKWDS